jgi:hypothetical protein
MRLHVRLRDVTEAILLLLLASGTATACLRETLDDRAVEWSKLIVVAKLSSIASPTSLVPPRDADVKSNSLKSYQLYNFEVVTVLDGTAKAGVHLPIIRFMSDPDMQKNAICEQPLTPKQIGKSFLLFLRPESDLRWSTRADQPDLRTQQVHDLKAFAVVHLESMRDLGDEGFADAKYTISSTRQAEAQFDPANAKVQVQVLLEAADDTEQAEAEHAILEMGPKALPALNHALAAARERVDRVRLTKMIDAVSPPSLTLAMQPR